MFSAPPIEKLSLKQLGIVLNHMANELQKTQSNFFMSYDDNGYPTFYKETLESFENTIKVIETAAKSLNSHSEKTINSDMYYLLHDKLGIAAIALNKLFHEQLPMFLFENKEEPEHKDNLMQVEYEEEEDPLLTSVGANMLNLVKIKANLKSHLHPSVKLSSSFFGTDMDDSSDEKSEVSQSSAATSYERKGY